MAGPPRTGILVLTDADLAHGFRLAGIEVHAAADAAAAAAALHQAVAASAFPLILVNERWVAQFDQPTARLVEQSVVPLILPIPTSLAWRHDAGGDSYVEELLRSSIGYHIRLGG